MKKILLSIVAIITVMNITFVPIKTNAEEAERVFVIQNIDASKEFETIVREYLDGLPDKVKSGITEELEIQLYKNNSTWGGNITEDGKIKTSNKGRVIIYFKEDSRDIYGTIAHEIGHALQSTHKFETGNKYSDEALFINCINQEKDSYKKANKVNAKTPNNAEVYCEVFSSYITNPEGLKKHSPLMYKYMRLYWE